MKLLSKILILFFLIVGCWAIYVTILKPSLSMFSHVTVITEIESPSKKYIATLCIYNSGGGFESVDNTLINVREKNEKFNPVEYQRTASGENWANLELKDNVLHIGGSGFPINVHWENDQVLYID